jgi:hypothetical protein
MKTELSINQAGRPLTAEEIDRVSGGLVADFDSAGFRMIIHADADHYCWSFTNYSTGQISYSGPMTSTK